MPFVANFLPSNRAPLFATIDIVASGGHLYQRHNDGRIWIYTGTPHIWLAGPRHRPGTVQIVADGDGPLPATRHGAMWGLHGTPHTGLRQLDASLAAAQ